MNGAPPPVNLQNRISLGVDRCPVTWAMASVRGLASWASASGGVQDTATRMDRAMRQRRNTLRGLAFCRG